MEGVKILLRSTQLHPVTDHFTIALLVVGILVDLIASLIPSRQWLRNMALTLMVLGAISAAASYLTGGVEIDRVWDMLSPEAKAYFHPTGTISKHFGHGHLGDNLMYLFALLALWRLAIHFVGFLAKTRPAYLAIAVIGLVLLIYQGKTGGELVYHYGIGVGAMEPGATPIPAAAGAPGASATAPLATPVTKSTEIPTPSAQATASPNPTSSAAGAVTASPTAEASPAASPAASATSANL